MVRIAKKKKVRAKRAAKVSVAVSPVVAKTQKTVHSATNSLDSQLDRVAKVRARAQKTGTAAARKFLADAKSKLKVLRASLAAAKVAHAKASTMDTVGQAEKAAKAKVSDMADRLSVKAGSELKKALKAFESRWKKTRAKADAKKLKAAEKKAAAKVKAAAKRAATKTKALEKKAAAEAKKTAKKAAKKTPAKKAVSGRKKKVTAKKAATGRRGRPPKAAAKKKVAAKKAATGRRGRPPKAAAKKSAGAARRGRPPKKS